jgi:hypothetical protein
MWKLFIFIGKGGGGDYVENKGLLIATAEVSAEVSARGCG